MPAESVESSRRSRRLAEPVESAHPGAYRGGRGVDDAVHRLLHRVGVPEGTRSEVVRQVRAHLKRHKAKADEEKKSRDSVVEALHRAGWLHKTEKEKVN